MTMHMEFVVQGPPISNQQRTTQGKANLAAGRATVAGEAQSLWAKPLLLGPLRAMILNFYAGNRPSVDIDNMSKPVLDAMQKIVYDNDRQIRQAEIIHLQIGDPYSVAGVSKILVSALQAGRQFMYVRLEDPVVPFPLPK